MLEPWRLWTRVHDAKLLVVLAILRYHRLVQLLCIPSLPIVIVVNSSYILNHRIIGYVAINDFGLWTLEIPCDVELLVDVLSKLPIFSLFNGQVLIWSLKLWIFSLVSSFLVLHSIHQRFIFTILASFLNFDAYSHICLISSYDFRTSFVASLWVKG